MSTIENRRGGMALRGAVVAGTATALLMGGFGAFALWSDTQAGGASGSIQTGQLVLDPVTDQAQWYLEDPLGGPAQPIELATYLASPGDVVFYTVPVTGVVQGTDITAELTVDLDSIDIDSSLVGPDAVEITAEGADGSPIVITGTDTGDGAFTQPVTVRVVFPSTMTGGMDLSNAVDVKGLNLVLQQQ
jgi:alternate signal-mediated exported protein